MRSPSGGSKLLVIRARPRRNRHSSMMTPRSLSISAASMTRYAQSSRMSNERSDFSFRSGPEHVDGLVEVVNDHARRTAADRFHERRCRSSKFFVVKRHAPRNAPVPAGRRLPSATDVDDEASSARFRVARSGGRTEAVRERNGCRFRSTGAWDSSVDDDVLALAPVASRARG